MVAVICVILKISISSRASSFVILSPRCPSCLLSALVSALVCLVLCLHRPRTYGTTLEKTFVLKATPGLTTASTLADGSPTSACAWSWVDLFLLLLVVSRLCPSCAPVVPLFLSSYLSTATLTLNALALEKNNPQESATLDHQ